MRNAGGSCWCSRVALLQQVLGSQAASHGLVGLRRLRVGTEGGDEVRPPLMFRALASLNLHLLLVYLLLFVLAKLFARLHSRVTSENNARYCQFRD
jgi:hypothetical protein